MAGQRGYRADGRCRVVNRTVPRMGRREAAMTVDELCLQPGRAILLS